MNIAINYLITRNLIISVSLTFGGTVSKAVSGERRITDYVQRIIEMPNILYYYYFIIII